MGQRGHGHHCDRRPVVLQHAIAYPVVHIDIFGARDISVDLDQILDTQCSRLQHGDEVEPRPLDLCLGTLRDAAIGVYADLPGDIEPACLGRRFRALALAGKRLHNFLGIEFLDHLILRAMANQSSTQIQLACVRRQCVNTPVHPAD